MFISLRKHFNGIGQELTNDKFVLLCCIGACNGYTANGLHSVYNSHYNPSGYRSFIRRLTTLVDSGLVERYHVGTDGRYKRYRLSRSCLSLVRRSIGKDVLSSIDSL